MRIIERTQASSFDMGTVAYVQMRHGEPTTRLCEVVKGGGETRIWSCVPETFQRSVGWWTPRASVAPGTTTAQLQGWLDAYSRAATPIARVKWGREHRSRLVIVSPWCFDLVLSLLNPHVLDCRRRGQGVLGLQNTDRGNPNGTW